MEEPSAEQSRWLVTQKPVRQLHSSVSCILQFALTITDKQRSVEEQARPENRAYQSHMH